MATSVYGLQPEQTVRLNGNDDLSSCVKANDSACVCWITLTGSPGAFDYVVNVNGEAPHGAFSGSMYTAFKDESGGVYHLKLTSSSRTTHTVKHNSSKPAIMSFKWSNTSIPDW